MNKYVLILIVLVMAATPALAQKVTGDFDRDYDFSLWKTFAWGEGGTAPGNDLSRKRLETAIRETLATSGMESVDGAGADFLVVYHAVVDQKTKNSAISVGVGASRRVSKRASIGVGVSTSGKKKTVEVGTLVIDLLDAKSGDLVWTTTATDTLKGDADARDAQVRSALKKAFSEFPPKG